VSDGEQAVIIEGLSVKLKRGWLAENESIVVHSDAAPGINRR
jgi:hypothetical protein